MGEVVDQHPLLSRFGVEMDQAAVGPLVEAGRGPACRSRRAPGRRRLGGSLAPRRPPGRHRRRQLGAAGGRATSAGGPPSSPGRGVMGDFCRHPGLVRRVGRLPQPHRGLFLCRHHGSPAGGQGRRGSGLRLFELVGATGVRRAGGFGRSGLATGGLATGPGRHSGNPAPVPGKRGQSQSRPRP